MVEERATVRLHQFAEVSGRLEAEDAVEVAPVPLEFANGFRGVPLRVMNANHRRARALA